MQNNQIQQRNQNSQVVEYTDPDQNNLREKFRNFMRNKIVLAVASIVFGIILIVWQRSALDSLVRILGIIMVAVAAVFIIMFAVQKEKKNSLIIVGIILAIVGAFFLIKPDFIVKLFPFIMGLILVISGISDLVGALNLPKGASGKTGIVITSLVLAALGVVCMFQPGIIANILILFIGILLLVNGVFDLVVLAMQNSAKKE